jgi:hypothetical protein
MERGLAAALFIFLCSVLEVGAVDLGDLQVPASRIPAWEPGVEGGVPDISSWPAINASAYGAVGDGAANDADSIQSAIDAAAGMFGTDGRQGTVVELDAGTYWIPAPEDILMKSHVVLRGKGPKDTRILMQHGTTHSSSKGGWGPFFFLGSTQGGYINVTAGAQKGSTSITLEQSAAWNAGDWIFIRLKDRAGFLNNPQTNNDGEDIIAQILKVTGVNGNIVSFDRPLQIDYELVYHPYVQKILPVSNSGVEDLKLEMRDDTIDYYSQLVKFVYAVNCWLRNVEGYRGDHKEVHFQYSARNTITGSYFHNLLWVDLGRYPAGKDPAPNGYGITLTRGTTDNLITNNIFDYLYNPVVLQGGASGNVVSYNYISGVHDRFGIFFHGEYPHSNLIEGNDINNSITFDIYWGQQGPYNTIFRNRIQEGYDHVHGSYNAIRTYRDGRTNPSWYVGSYFNILGNSPIAMWQAPGVLRDWDIDTDNSWLERNVWRFNFIISNPPAEPTTTVLNNMQSDFPPAAWSDFKLPDSLYLDAVPQWWCQETPWPAVGADVDNFTSGGANLHMLPAERRFRDMACNKVGLPQDTQPPAQPSGLRVNRLSVRS